MVKFPVGSHVNRSGYHGVVTAVYPGRDNVMEACDVRLDSGEVHVVVCDLIPWGDSDPCGGRSCDECEIGGCDHGTM